MTLGTEQLLAQQFQALSAEVASKLDEGHEAARLAALKAAKNAVQQLQTPLEYLESQLWAPVDLVGAAIASDLKIPEILSARDGPMKLDEIAGQVKGARIITFRVLRLLAAQGMVDQISEDVYAANRFTRFYSQEIPKACVFKQITCTPAYTALPFFLRKNGFENSTDPDNCAWHLGLNTEKSYWQYIESVPELNDAFNMMMQMGRGKHGDDLAEQYPFETVFNKSSPDEVAFVDVGGGVGHQCLNLRRTFPPSYGRFVLQDQPYVVKGLELKDVEVSAVDIMTSQPIKGAKVYYLRGVCHDHSDEINRKLLNQVKSAMSKDSKLLIHDKLVADMNPSLNETRMDFIMMSQLGAMERSVGQFSELLESVGFKVVGRYGSGATEWRILEAEIV